MLTACSRFWAESQRHARVSIGVSLSTRKFLLTRELCEHNIAATKITESNAIASSRSLQIVQLIANKTLLESQRANSIFGIYIPGFPTQLLHICATYVPLMRWPKLPTTGSCSWIYIYTHTHYCMQPVTASLLIVNGWSNEYWDDSFRLRESTRCALVRAPNKENVRNDRIESNFATAGHAIKSNVCGHKWNETRDFALRATFRWEMTETYINNCHHRRRHHIERVGELIVM